MGSPLEIPRAWTGRSSPYPSNATVAELFLEQLNRDPKAVAVSDGSQTLTYGELYRQAGNVAVTLNEHGVSLETGVAILTRRSVEMIVSMLATSLCGASYVPIDEHCPPERLRWILRDTASSVVLTDRENEKRLDGIGCVKLLASEAAKANEGGTKVLPASGAGPLSRAYVMYTSGSTGEPKGVEVLNRGIVRLVKNTNYVQFDSSDVVAQVANPAFDATTFEVWGALLNGARLVILDAETILSPRSFADALKRQGVTTMFLTASLFSILAATVPDAFGRMRTLVAGGDAVNPEAARTVLRTAPPGRLVNGYGPTECTTFSVCHHIAEVPESASLVPIGCPIANSEAYILDEQLKPVPIGAAGELYLGGDGLARGYLNRPELTAERFIRHPFSTEAGARLYRTGDLARFTEEGVIEFLGRRDHQVKLFGYRIELGEIESNLRAHPLVIDAAVQVVRVSASNDHLAAYVSVRTPDALGAGDLRSFLASRLPHYMVPAEFHIMHKLPLNAVGKIDRGKLAGQLAGQVQTSRQMTSLENQIAGIWQQTLMLPSVDADSNFFDLGGSSLALALVENKLRAITTKPFSVTDLFRYPTVTSLARFFAEETEEVHILSEAQQRARMQRIAFRSRPGSSTPAEH